MIWITDTDLLVQIKSERLSQVVDEDDTILADAEASAIAIVKDALHARFDTEGIFSTTGADRPAQVIRWIRAIMLYDIAGRLPEKMVSERIIKNYDDAIATLEAIEDGKKNTNLPVGGNTDTSTKTKFRWGSNSKRVHDFS